MFQILSLDGGGIRGAFSAAVLAAIERDLRVDICDHFDLITGTSTGGIIAIGLGLGLSPKEILDFYLSHGSNIFANTLGLRSISHWFRAKYDSVPLEEALRKTLGEEPLGASKKRLVIPAYNMGQNDVYLFRTPHLTRLARDYRIPAWKVAMATSAAPSFLPISRELEGMRLVDGGVWANNPTLAGLAEAAGALEIDLKEVSVLNIGTLFGLKKYPGYLDWGGRLTWALHAHKLILDASSLAVQRQAALLLSPARYHRIDATAPDSVVSLDDLGTLDDLIAAASHHSRRAIPQVEDFFKHTASDYVPCHRPEKGTS